MTDQVYACTHERLRFGSGAFYVICAKCGARWVAIALNDEDLDYRRGISGTQGNLADQERIKP